MMNNSTDAISAKDSAILSFFRDSDIYKVKCYGVILQIIKSSLYDFYVLHNRA